MKRLTLLFALLLAAPAQAGTITAFSERTDEYLGFTAAPGERNEVRVELQGSKLRITDTAGAPTGPCPQVASNAVLCGVTGSLIVDLGDGDDTLLVTAGERLDSAYGGSGNDRMVATAGAELDGGDGDDVLEGSPETDKLTGGPGTDQLSGGRDADLFVVGEGVDRVDGGPGQDAVSYARVPNGVTVDLSRDTGGAGDVLTSIESAGGTKGDDVLIGDDASNSLIGGGGRDRLVGRGGDDGLQGVGRLSGGAGDDVLFARGETAATCGAGRDRVWATPASRTTLIRCERITGWGPDVRIAGGRITLRWQDFRVRPCRVRVNGRAFRRLSGQSLALRRPATVRIRARGACGERAGDDYGPLTFRIAR